MGQTFVYSSSLSRSEVFGGTRAISYYNCRLSRAALVEIFTNLGTASGAQTITITGNPGAASLDAADRLIATSKGWTIAG